MGFTLGFTGFLDLVLSMDLKRGFSYGGMGWGIGALGDHTNKMVDSNVWVVVD